MTQINTTQKIHSCLNFMDQRLNTSSEQTIRIAEIIINDIKQLTEGYQAALKTGALHQHYEQVRTTQKNWINLLHNIILEQNSQELNAQMLQTLKKFAIQLNEQLIETFARVGRETKNSTPTGVSRKIKM